MEDAVRVLQQQVNEFTDFDNQENVPSVDTLELTLFGVESKSSQIWSKFSSFDFQVENSGRTVQYKLNAQSLRLFGLHSDVNGVRLQNKQNNFSE